MDTMPVCRRLPSHVTCSTIVPGLQPGSAIGCTCKTTWRLGEGGRGQRGLEWELRRLQGQSGVIHLHAPGQWPCTQAICAWGLCPQHQWDVYGGIDSQFFQVKWQHHGHSSLLSDPVTFSSGRPLCERGVTRALH